MALPVYFQAYVPLAWVGFVHACYFVRELTFSTCSSLAEREAMCFISEQCFNKF